MLPFFKRVVVEILTWEARMVLSRHKPKIIAVTGSVGKTTTKDAIYAAISNHDFVRKSEKSMNSDIGVPLTVLGLDNAWSSYFKWIKNILLGFWRVLVPEVYPHWLILEVGADRPGDIRALAQWLRPDIAVLTGVPDMPPHVEFFSSPEELVREKRTLVEHLRPGGKVVVNGDDLRMREVHRDFRGACVTYGIEPDNDYVATHTKISYKRGKPTGMKFRLERAGSSHPVEISGALGTPRVYAALAALAVADVVGVDGVYASEALALWEPPPGRMRVLDGLRGSVIIDDTYNSSPAAAFAALDTLKEVEAKRKIAVLGDMLELGKYSADAHRQVGKRAAECADILLTVGFRSRATAEAALDAGMKDENIRQYEHNESRRAGKELELMLAEGDTILIKGSQSIRMERAVEEIMAEPQRAAQLLVRQEPEWLDKQ